MIALRLPIYFTLLLSCVSPVVANSSSEAPKTLFERLIDVATVPIVSLKSPLADYGEYLIELSSGDCKRVLFEQSRRNLATIEFHKKTASRTLDLLFDQSISGYSEPIQKTLKKLYFDGTGVADVSGFLESGIAARAQPLLNGTDIIIKVEADELLRALPLIRKVTLIHEIAVHAGQYLERFVEVGPNQSHSDFHSPDWRHFTELSAAVLESKIHKLIPSRYFEDELEASSIPEAYKKTFKKNINFAAKIDTERYAAIRDHLYYSRGDAPKITLDQIGRFLHVYNQTFDRSTVFDWAMEQLKSIRKTGSMSYKYLPTNVWGLTIGPMTPAGKPDLVSLMIERTSQLELGKRRKKMDWPKAYPRR